MKQLGILDSAFINLEHPNTPQHIGGLGIYDQSTAPGGTVRFKEVIASFERKLKKLPLFRTRLVQVPGGYDRPYWIKDDNFDVEFHLRHIALPKPGDWRQLCILIARIHARPLDMSRPLWEAYIIEGLDNIPHLPKNCFAVYTKMHHSLVDGAGGSSFMAALHDLEANPGASDEEDEPTYLGEHEPTRFNMLTRGTINTVRNSVDLVKGLYKTGFEVGKNVLDVARGDVPMPDIRAPKTRFNNPVGPYRAFEAALFELEDFKAIKNATGSKVNDVALAIISGGLRHYLQHHNELPGESLSAIMPLNMRTRRGDNEENNQIGSIFANIHTNIEDPIERMHAIHKSTDEAKEFGEQTPLVDALKLAGVFSPRLTKGLVHFYIDNKLTEKLPVNISSVISNVPGPPFPLYCSGAKLVQYHGVGLLTPGVGLFHLVMSYCGTVTITIIADRDIMPDPSFYRECLERSFAELKAAALKKSKVVKHKTKAEVATIKEATVLKEVNALKKEMKEVKEEIEKLEDNQASA
ncbi:MAG TPA: wax ester/triacylglycerol synthase family O-acyltransferase [Pseudomonadales bacterium]|nr:wax ester/triacylglycerol synthase family O-acyltransferase [Pseudomonadales bacterium]